MASKTAICNMALSHVGAKTVLLVDSEQSAEAAICRTFYDIARDTLLRLAQWPFATKIQSLGLVTENPTNQWGYSYQYPADCMRFIKIVDEGYYTYEVGTNQAFHTELVSRIPHEIYYGTSGAEIYTNQKDAVGKYTVAITETGRFPSDFTLALSYKLASLIAPSVVGARNYGLVQLVKQMDAMATGIAAANAYNEETKHDDRESEYTRIRY